MQVKFKKITSLLLSLMMLLTFFPTFAFGEGDTEGGDINVMSLLPLEEVYVDIDLSDFLPAALSSIKVSDILSRMVDDEGNPVTIDENATTVWEDFFDENGDSVYDVWKKTSMNDVIDIAPVYYNRSLHMQLIVGSGAQLDPNNVRYIADISLPNNTDTYKFDMYEQTMADDSPNAAVERKEIETEIITGNYYYQKEDGSEIYAPYYRLYIAPKYSNNEDYYMNISLNEELYSGYTIKVYDGFYETAEAAVEAAAADASLDLTSIITGQDMTKKDAGLKEKWVSPQQRKNLTIVYYKDNQIAAMDRFGLDAKLDSLDSSSVYTDLSDCLITDLGSIKISDLLDRTYDNYGDEISVGENARVWSNIYNEEDDEIYDTWTEASPDGTINLYPIYYDESLKLHLIIGSGTRLEKGNKEYIVNIYFPDPADHYQFDLYEQIAADNSPNADVTRNAIQTDAYSYTYGSEIVSHDSVYKEERYIELNIESKYSPESDYYMNISLNEELYSGYTIKVYEGFYETAEAAVAAAEADESLDLTSVITGQNMTKKDAGLKEKWADYQKHKKLTIVYYKNNQIAAMDRFHLYAFPNVHSVSGYGLYKTDGEITQVSRNKTSDNQSFEDGSNLTTETYTLSTGYSDDTEYYYYMRAINGDTHNEDASIIKKAVVGDYNSLEAASRQPDIKDKLFASPEEGEEGYKANFSGNGVKFTVFSDSEIWKFVVKAKAQAQISTEAPPVGSSDRYFSVSAIYDADENSIDSYVVPYNEDTYYSNGYQTVLLNNADVDMTALRPYAYLGNNAKVYHDGVIEETENSSTNILSAQDFTKEPSDPNIEPKNSVKYTVSAENHINQKNYNLTVVKKTHGAKLFVNGPNEREIFLDDFYDNVHDIFIANIGDEELTGLKVELNATNVKLDDYWTVGGEKNDTLAPFTTTSNNGTWYGELPNVGKIRLIPDGEGDINGTLTISADGQEPRVITLKGKAGNPKIDTESLVEAVKYVPYQSIITTNNMHDWVQATFSLSKGKLPEGVKLLPSGELYGVPKESGEFPIRVRASFSDYTFAASVAEFTLKVMENTDANVDAQTDDGYEIITRVPDSIKSDTEQIFEFEYDYGEHKEEFQGFWLDGEKLKEDEDYLVEPGSTKITIKSQTIKNAGSGKHTIAAEYRSNSTNEVKKAAQNYTRGSSSSKKGGGGGGSSLPSYKVWFEVNGGAWLDSVTVNKGDTISELPIPERTGYAFKGWYKDEKLTQPFDKNEKINSTTVLYAKWSQIFGVWFETNCGIWVDHMDAEEGSTLSSLPSPKRNGYVFDGWYKDEELTQPFDTTTKVESTIVVYAKWLADELPDNVLGFRDVKESDWFYEDIDWAYNNEYMVGVGELLFAPSNPITGGMAVSVLARMADIDVDKYADKSFSDIFENEWYTNSAKWAKTEGLVDTIPFNPPVEITREQMGVLIDKYLEKVAPDIEYTDEEVIFADESEITPSAKQSMQKLFNLGIYYGRGDNIIDPKSNTTRAEFAALMRRVDKYLNK